MQQAQSPQTPGTVASWRQLGDDDAVRVANHDNTRSALTIDEQADLASQFGTEQPEFSSLFQGVPAQSRVATLVQAGQGLDLAWLESGCIAVDRGGYVGTSVRCVDR